MDEELSGNDGRPLLESREIARVPLREAKDAQGPQPNSHRAINQAAHSNPFEPHRLHEATILQLQRAAGNQTVCSLLELQRAPAGASAPPATTPSGPEGADVLERTIENDIDFNKGFFLTGLGYAATLFAQEVNDQLQRENAHDRDEIWKDFARALGALSISLLCPVLGLEAVGILHFVETYELVIDPILANPKGKSEEDALADVKRAIMNYFIGSQEGSVAKAIDKIDSKAAAANAVARYKLLATVLGEKPLEQMRIVIARELFQPDVLAGSPAYRVKTSNVNEHAYEQMTRMWSLQTVAARAKASWGKECIGGTCASDAVNAYMEKALEIFPDLLEKMKEYIPDRYDYWNKHGISGNDIPKFSRDVDFVARRAGHKEFGLPAATRYGAQLKWPTY